jgi:superkiller protein 3
VTLGGAGWLWIRSERDARTAQLTRDVNDALNQATARREQAKAATPGGAALLAQAREQAQRALALAGSGPIDAGLVRQVRQLQAELDDEEKDRALITSLDEARLAQAETLADRNSFATRRAVPKFQEAFRAYGLPVGKGEPETAAQRIRQRPAAVREVIVAALDEWDDLASWPNSQVSEPHWKWLRAVLEAAEPNDAWGRKVRAARREPDRVKQQAALEALAASADVDNVPVRALTRLAHSRLFAGGNTLLPTVAAKLLRRAQRKHPDDFWVNEHLGLLLQEVTPPNLDEAVRFLTAAVALRPDSPGAHLNLGCALKAKGQFDEAIACDRKAVALDPKYVAAHNNLGNGLACKGQFDEAIACYRRAIALDPRWAPSHGNLGNVLREKGQLARAIASWRKAIELDPKIRFVHSLLGAALHKEGQLNEAITCLREAITLDPKDALAHDNLGHALRDKGQLDEAITCYRKALELDPKRFTFHFNLGRALLDRGEIDEAITLVRKALELDSRNAMGHGFLGSLLHQKGQLDEAIACFRKATLLDPKLPFPHGSLGNALLGKGQFDKAIASFQRAIELDPGYLVARIALGNALARQSRVDEAIACFKKAIELNPKVPKVHALLGLNLFRMGCYAEARDASARAFELLPESDPRRASAALQLRECKRFLKLEERLPRILREEDKPSSPGESLDLARMCQHRQMHVAAARFAAAAFAAHPKQASDLQASHRYNAACSASLAAAGHGKDAGELDRRDRLALRRQALTWLRGDLKVWARLLTGGPPAARAAVQQALKRWQQDSDLAAVRDEDALAKLPAEERAAFAAFWSDVAALLKKAEAAATKEDRR